ncbi:MAG TPA: hypothetical protein DIC34_09325 [Treponema sp.]|nr:MAG: hypothetical protein A2001_02120 [Treponema sp. GWC1_61_84]OHE76331.1 MAG: hypothetical protein A2413_16275 [Treponema sp. RIFOXYC1_FULL_61_9]HCM26728.1 hypothetical protein [Treponema sp.]
MYIFWSTIIGMILAAMLAHSLYLFAKVHRNAPVKLNGVEALLCARIIDAGLGKPFICRKALKDKSCPCRPCLLLDKAKEGKLAFPVPL